MSRETRGTSDSEQMLRLLLGIQQRPPEAEFELLSLAIVCHWEANGRANRAGHGRADRFRKNVYRKKGKAINTPFVWREVNELGRWDSGDACCIW